MNVFQLVLKQMRQRALGTWLTLLSVTLGVALVVAVLLVRRGGESLFGQTEYGYDLIVGKGSPLQLTLNTVYHIDQSPGNISYEVYEALARPRHPQARLAVPVSVGDTYKGLRVVGTLPTMFLSRAEALQPLTRLLGKLEAAIQETQAAPDAAALRKLVPRHRELLAEVQSLRKDFLYAYPATHAPIGQAVGQTEVAALSLDEGDKKGAVSAQQAAAQQLKEAQRLAEQSGASPLEYRPGKHFQLADGAVFHPRRFQAVIGSEVGRATGLKLGDEFQVTHGMGDVTGDEHAEKWKVVGVLKPTQTANDRVLFVPLSTTFSIESHEEGMRAQHAVREGGKPAPPGARRAPASPGGQPGGEEDGHDDHVHAYKENPDGTIDPILPKEQWLISAVVVEARSPFLADALRYNINASRDAVAVSPALVMNEFFNNVFKGGSTVLLLIALLVSVVAAVGILVSIYNSVSARLKEIAILRALGATRRRILVLICLEAGLIGLIGGLVGWVVGHLIGAVASGFMDRVIGQGFNWLSVGPWEWAYLAGVTVIAVLAGLVPALKAYRTPVATHLVAS